MKTQTYYTSGTASEKLLAVPHKYADIPDAFGKPLLIICIAGAEKLARDKHSILGKGPHSSSNKCKFMELYKSLKISYIGASEILDMIKI